MKGLDYEGETFETELLRNGKPLPVFSKEREIIREVLFRKDGVMRFCRANSRKGCWRLERRVKMR